MARLNNVDMAAFRKTMEGVKAGTDTARTMQKVVGEWQLTGEGPQFRSVAPYPGGELVMETDMSKTMGGGALMPGPMRFAFFGLAASYAGVFAQTVSLMGIELQKFTVTVEAPMNLAKSYGVGDAPLVGDVKFTVSVKSTATREKLEEAQRLALDRTPGVYALAHPLKVTSEVQVLA
ncbi:MAG: OsmC family protein [Chloroflexi bacterium]|nr:OsmC family protein [Chloroflexota bacterium]